MGKIGACEERRAAGMTAGAAAVDGAVAAEGDSAAAVELEGAVGATRGCRRVYTCVTGGR